jgi:hypothetical protein
MFFAKGLGITMVPRLLVIGFAAALALLSCSGDDERARKSTDVSAVSARSAPPNRWGFVDAFAALKSPDPKTRLEAIDWIGRHLATHASLAKEALRAAAADEDPAVAVRAKSLLRRLGD